MGFADHFSGHAGDYAAARPTYPAALFDELAARAPGRAWAWDVGCGNGQATLPLLERFDRVLASEPSLDQLAHAPSRLRGRLVAAAAESAVLGGNRVDLVVVAQAAHWFDMRRFAAAVTEAARPGALVAVWCYRTLLLDDPVLDEMVERWYTGPLEAWWPAGREHIDAAYTTLEFPFVEEAPLAVEMVRDWTLPELGAYLDTWSAVRRYRKARGEDPLVPFLAQLAPGWGEGRRRVRWPLAMRLGRVGDTGLRHRG